MQTLRQPVISGLADKILEGALNSFFLLVRTLVLNTKCYLEAQNVLKETQVTLIPFGYWFALMGCRNLNKNLQKRFLLRTIRYILTLILSIREQSF